MNAVVFHRECSRFIFSHGSKVSKKFDLVIGGLVRNEKPIIDAYVKHISNKKYSDLYEIRFQVSGKLIRILFANDDKENDIIFLHAFEKNDKKDTDKAIEIAYNRLKAYKS